ncbi:MAG TPA: LPXTG cell wall anchor domain-containing protein [Bryobacteraceae bacterium]
MNRLVTLAACVGLTAAIAFAPAARADQWNKRTVMTINEPIQVPNKVLPPGKYVVKLLDSPSDRHIVQIFDQNEQHLITTILAMPNYRLEPTGKTVFTFWETPPGQPPALRAWFYPGDNYGQEFAYPKSVATQIAAVAHAPVPTTEATQQQDLATAPVTTTAPPEQPEQPRQEVAQNTPPPAPETPAPAPAPAPAPQELPKTGSPYPLIGLAGLASLGMYALLRAFRTA